MMINAGARFTKTREVTIAIAWPALATSVVISNDPQFGIARAFGRNEQIDWTLAKLGRTSRSRTVYARFDSGELAFDTIAIDDDPPVIKRVNARPSLRVSSGARTTYVLGLLIRDSGSGVGAVQIKSTSKRKPVTHDYEADGLLNFSTAAHSIRLRALDKVGNASGWKTVTLP
jgi:hypothetical protein